MAGLLQEPGESSRKLGVDEELHAAPSGTHPAAAGRECPELQGGQQIVALEVGIILQYVIDRHARRQQLQQAFHRIPQPAHRRLTVADRWVRRDPRQSGHEPTVPPPEPSTPPRRNRAGVTAAVRGLTDVVPSMTAMPSRLSKGSSRPVSRVPPLAQPPAAYHPPVVVGHEPAGVIVRRTARITAAATRPASPVRASRSAGDAGRRPSPIHPHARAGPTPRPSVGRPPMSRLIVDPRGAE